MTAKLQENLLTTEALPSKGAIDTLDASAAAALFLEGQQAAILAVADQTQSIIRAAHMMANSIRANGNIIYAAAGSSGLMALADGCELSGTFGVPASSIRIHMAGGIPIDGAMPGFTEDDEAAALNAVQGATKNDTFIIISASGSTPYALSAAKAAKSIGAGVVGIANNRATPLLDFADIAICLETPAEVIAGSTRLAAGTAQKAALNLMSSLMGVELGHVYNGLMVNLVADNIKLAARAARVVAQIADVEINVAQAALAQTNGSVKPAILVALGSSLGEAIDLLKTHDGHLGPCINAVK